MAVAAIPEQRYGDPAFPHYTLYPRLRFMGSKHRLLPWIEAALAELEFETALDAFSGSGCVAYLLKTMGKTVHANDQLRFAADLTAAAVVNSDELLDAGDVALLRSHCRSQRRFIQRKFKGIFFTDVDNRFLDQVWAHLPNLTAAKRSLALSALYRSCLKKQPRGVFSVSGLGRYDDGRRDLRISLEQHFIESVEVFNALVFDSGKKHVSTAGDVFALDGPRPDLVYLDPPYVPRADDNCYIKRYHFVEGLASYWQGVEFHPTSKVRKLKKRYTPFSYRREAVSAFDRMFAKFARSKIVLSYSSNGYPDLGVLVDLLGRYKDDVTVLSEQHRYHFGTHGRVSAERSLVTELLDRRGLVTLEEYVASLAPVRAAPTGEAVAEHLEIRAAAETIAALEAVTVEAVAAAVADDPKMVRALGLAVGLSKERLGNQPKHHFGTAGSVLLARERPADLIGMLDSEFALIAVLDAERGKAFNYGDVLVARAGTRQNAGEAQAGGRAVEDAVEAVAKELKLPYALRTQFVGRGGRSAPCDLAIPGGGADAGIVCAAKGFDSTGSKLSDAVREIEEMAEVRRPTQFVYAVVDGIGWHRRASDLRRIFELFEQNRIDGLYTVAMLPRFAQDVAQAAEILRI